MRRRPHLRLVSHLRCSFVGREWLPRWLAYHLSRSDQQRDGRRVRISKGV